MNDVPTRLLRETLQARVPAASSQACLDAETVAAWADDTLPRREREAAEAHAADCARCQTLLAAMATTAPPETAGRSWWRLPALKWIVPLTVATAALLVWVNVPEPAVAPSAPIATREAKIEPPPALADATSNAPPPATMLAQEGRTAAAQPPAAPNASLDKERRAKLDTLKQSAAGASRDEARVTSAKTLAEAANRVDAAAAKPEATARQAMAAAAPAQPAAEAAAPPPPVPSPALRRSTAAPPVAMSARMFDARPSPRFASPNPAIVWRLATNGAVERSTDSGSTWQRQSTGVTVTLTAGAAPSSLICWLVGPQGTVLITTDGRSWRGIAFPETVDLVSVRASDDKSATVTTADGRAFSTTDGGVTWTR